MTQIRDEEGTQHYSTLEAWNVRETDFPKDGSLSQQMSTSQSLF
jgi:hypothetical protein